MLTTHFRPWLCPHCGYTMDAATHAGLEDAVPREGDLSLCINCGQPMILTEGYWRSLGAADWRRLTKPERSGLVQAILLHQALKMSGRIGDLTQNDGSGRA